MTRWLSWLADLRMDILNRPAQKLLPTKKGRHPTGFAVLLYALLPVLFILRDYKCLPFNIEHHTHTDVQKTEIQLIRGKEL